MVHEVEIGKTKRMSFSKIEEVLDMPDLIEIQKKFAGQKDPTVVNSGTLDIPTILARNLVWSN